MKIIISIIAALLISIMLTFASDYFDQHTKLINNVIAIKQIEDFSKNLDPSSKESLNNELQENAKVSIEDILKRVKPLNIELVAIFKKNNLDIVYYPPITENFSKYIYHRFSKMIIFFIISLLATLSFNAYRILAKTKFCIYNESLPDSLKLREVLHLTIGDILRDPNVYNKISSPAIAFRDDITYSNVKFFIEKNAKSGYVFILPNCSFLQYAEIALALDNNARISIKSTNLTLPETLFNEGKKDKVKEHLAHVNSSGLEVRRIQIFNNATEKNVFFQNILVNPIEKVKYEYKLFKECYLSPKPNVNCNWGIIGTNIDVENNLGDYIIYDDKVILKYDFDTSTLMLLVGPEMIETHSNIFNITLPDFKTNSC